MEPVKLSDIESNTLIQEILNYNGIFSRDYIDKNLFEKFNRFGYLDPYNTLSSNREYLFFVKPDLHIFSGGNSSNLNPELNRLSIFTDAMSRYKDVLLQLQASASKHQPYVTLLSNRINSKLDLPGISAESIETGRNIYGSVISYRQNSIKSDTDYDFTLEFKDTKYLDVYMFFKLFDEYERRKFTGSVTPPNENYIINKILHDQMAIYKIIVGEDGESIIYWAKLVGVYPVSVPRDSFSSIDDHILNFSVNFKASFVEDMNPDILVDLNRTSWVKSNESLIKIYNPATDLVNADWSPVPIVIKDKNSSSRYHYKLKWRM